MSAFITSLKKDPFTILLVFLLIACAVTAWPLLRPSVFQAEARINIPKIKNSPIQQSATLQTAVEILRGNVLAEQVMTTIGTTQLFPGLEQKAQGEKDFLSHALANFQQQLSITPVKETRIINISFKHQEAELAALVVETLIRLFQKKYRKFQFLEEPQHDERLLFARQQMQQAARTLSTLQQQSRLLLIEESRDKLAEQHDTIKNLLINEQESLQQLSNQLTQQEEQFTATLKPDHQGKEHKAPEALSQAPKDLIRLQLYEQEIRTKYGEGSSGDQLLANIHLQITSLKKLLYTKAAIPEAEQAKLDDTAEQIVAVRMSYHGQQRKTELLQRQLQQVENKLQQMTEQSEKLNELQQQADTTQKQYTDLAKQFETERTLRESAEQIRIIEKTVVPLRPIKPQQGATLILAFLSGLIGSIVYGVIRAVGKGTSTN